MDYIYELGQTETVHFPTQMKENSYLTLTLLQGQRRTKTVWTQKYVTDYLASIGGLFTSFFAWPALIVSGYQNFVAQKSVFKRLYGEEETDQQDDPDQSIDDTSSPKDLIRTKIEKRKEFSASYWSYTLVSCFKRLCCCCPRCCCQRASCRRLLDRHRKM